MTFDKFKADFLTFLENSTVNLGRRNTKTRQAFLSQAYEMFKVYDELNIQAEICNTAKPPKVNTKEPKPDPMNDRVLRIPPNDGVGSLNIGKNVHAMTSDESARTDEELGRSPFGNSGKKGQNE